VGVGGTVGPSNNRCGHEHVAKRVMLQIISVVSWGAPRNTKGEEGEVSPELTAWALRTSCSLRQISVVVEAQGLCIAG